MKYRYSVITCNFGGYEIMREIENPLEDVEYIYITDDTTIKSNTWHIVYDNFYDQYNSAFDKVVIFRSKALEYINSDICIRIDASIQINGLSFENIIKELDKTGSDISFIISPRFSNIYGEMMDWNIQRNIPKEKTEQFMVYYRLNEKNDDIISKNTICTLGILIQRNNELNKQINKKQITILNDIKNINNDTHYYRIDQIVFTYVINKFFDYVRVLVLDYSVIFNEYTHICIHNSNVNLFDVLVSQASELYLFNKPILRIFDGFNYITKLTKQDIINNSKKIHINLPREIFSNKKRYDYINNSYKDWIQREDVNIIDMHEFIYINSHEYERFLNNRSNYENVLYKICEVLNINFNEKDFVMVHHQHLDMFIPKEIVTSHVFVPILTLCDDNYVHIEYTPSKSFKKVNTFSLFGFLDDTVYNNTISYNESYRKQCSFSLTPFKITKNKQKRSDDRILLVITDGSIIPYIHILNYYFYEVIVIDNTLNNMSFEFLYAYEHITDILILTSQNKSLNLITDNL